MKYNILGYSQRAALDLGLSLGDLLLLRYLDDLMAAKNIVSQEFSGRTYYWVKYGALIKSLPILGLSRTDSLGRRLKKLVDLGLLDRRILKEGGSFSYYRFASNYGLLFCPAGGPGARTLKDAGQGGVGPGPGTNNYSLKDSSPKDIDDIYRAWNRQGLMVHSCLSLRMTQAIMEALQVHSREEVIQAIDNYGFIVRSEDYYFSHRWSLADFLGRGLEKFMDPVASRNLYRRGGSGKKLEGTSRGGQEEDLISKIRRRAQKNL